MAHILLIEDDQALAEGLEYALKLEQFTVSHAKTLERADQLLSSQSFNLIILDVMLPDGSGLDYCVKVRQRFATPVLFLTACDQEYQIILGLDRGADDYVTKPFRVRELISRIRVILRRGSAGGATHQLISGGLTLDVNHALLEKDRRSVQLTPLEYKLLHFLMCHPSQTLSRSQILAELWDNGGRFVDDNTLSVNIRRLREKIDEPGQPSYIATIRGIGYLWEQEVRSL
ncbi:MAG: response regulator transcription factor [Christensenellales bacterium]